MSHRFTSKGQRGFTLAEILVTTAIFAIIMIAALTVYDRSNKVFKTSTEAADMQQSTRIAFDKLVSDLRMAGFDYSRGGIPTGPSEYQQPDEQIEFAGPTAVVFRANFDYTTNAANNNGLAADSYAPMSVSGRKIFPFITTDNNEIVAYVLRSTAPGAANSNSISFYADVEVPRRAYPNVSGQTTGGHPENNSNAVTISGIDTSNDHPPYTLYRVTYDDIANNRVGTPVAENIRSLQFKYYMDGLGTTLLKNFDGSAITTGRNAGGGTFTADNTGAIGGDGLYDPANVGTTSNYDDRSARQLIQSIRMSLVGMNSSPEFSYQNPSETNTAFKNYREYSLSTLLVPRNLGLTGFPEPSFDPPGPPVITGACVGHCGAPFITWRPPSSGGPVVTYDIRWDTDPNGAFTSPHEMPINDASTTSAVVKDSGDLNPAQIIYYRVYAINDNGETRSDNYAVVPQNTTKPSPPALPGAGTFATNNETNQITLNWTSPSTNDVTTTTMSCSGTASAVGTNIPDQESIGYQIWRGTTQNFDPSAGQGVMVLDFDTPSQPGHVTPGAGVTWVDAAGVPAGPVISLAPPAACVQYYYRIRALDRCYKNAAMNVSLSVSGSISDWFPALNQMAIAGSSTSTSTPATPTNMVLDPNPANTQCPFGATTLCHIALQWNKTVTDTGGAGVAVDTYTLLRERRIQGIGAAWAPDLTNGTNGMRDISGFSTGGTIASFTDDTAAYSVVAGIGIYEYRYSVAAKICSNSSPQFSNTVTYPGCNFAVDVTAPGSTGDGSFATPFVMGYGDTIITTHATGNQLSTLRYTLLLNGAGVDGPYNLTGVGPHTYSWQHQADGVVYELKIDMTDTAGCTMSYVRYLQQQPPAGCSFLALNGGTRPTGPPGVTLSGPTNGTGAADFNFVFNTTPGSNFAITNDQTGNDTMTFSIANGNPGGPFTGTMKVVWADVNGLHPEMALTRVDWVRKNSSGSSLGTASTTISGAAMIFTKLSSSITLTATSIQVDSATTLGAIGTTGTAFIDSEAVNYTVADATHLTITRAALGTTAATHSNNQEVEKVMTTTFNAPTSLTIGQNESLEFNLHFTFDRSHRTPSLNTSGQVLRSVCLTYKVTSDPTTTQSCNLVGKSATSANPSSCD
jgi:prepilin-type N-terminal cleavage/methylation domain-containing protein